MTSKHTPLKVYAGREAYAHIQKKGLKADDIAVLLGASSGPKWLVLQGIDQFLLAEFFKDRTKALHLLGTSAGAWRMASYALSDSETDPLAAHKRFTEAYVEQCYPEKPTAQQVLDGCREVVRALLGDTEPEAMLKHSFARMNLITTQCHGLTQLKPKAAKLLGFTLAALMNRISRKTLGKQFSRVLMHHPDGGIPLGELDDLPSRLAPLSVQNLEDAILSTGSIPLIIEGVHDVAGKGVYQDGGITDYGFDLPILPEDGFVLYPHFAKYPVPGWFDKGWISQAKPWRTASSKNYSKTIMLVPSDDFIAALPYGKIPDRHDFLKLSDQARIQYWRKTIELTQLLAEDLAHMDWQGRVEPLPW
jgi:hypothetical protein